MQFLSQLEIHRRTKPTASAADMSLDTISIMQYKNTGVYELTFTCDAGGCTMKVRDDIVKLPVHTDHQTTASAHNVISITPVRLPGCNHPSMKL